MTSTAGIATGGGTTSYRTRWHCRTLGLQWGGCVRALGEPVRAYCCLRVDFHCAHSGVMGSQCLSVGGVQGGGK